MSSGSCSVAQTAEQGEVEAAAEVSDACHLVLAGKVQTFLDVGCHHHRSRLAKKEQHSSLRK
jgi:hypothetical protein